MSLIKGPWVMLGCAAAIAIAAPISLVQQSKTERTLPQPVVSTALEIAPVATLELAQSAPVFSPQRAAFDATIPIADAALDVPEIATPLPVLVGIIERGGRGVALMKRNDGQTVTVGHGDAVDGWQLTRIQRDSISLSRDGERREVALDFSNKNSSPGAQIVASDVASGGPPVSALAIGASQIQTGNNQ